MAKKVNIEIFNSYNFTLLKRKMEDMLVHKDFFTFIVGRLENISVE
jgi:hypothetical protein